MKHVELSSAGAVVTVRSAPYPTAKNPITMEAPDNVECGWVKHGDEWIEPAESIAHRSRKVWANPGEFIGEFNLAERGAVELSTDPIMAALRITLATWQGEVWSDDPRIQLGLATMVNLGIINGLRMASILSTPQ